MVTNKCSMSYLSNIDLNEPFQRTTMVRKNTSVSVIMEVIVWVNTYR